MSIKRIGVIFMIPAILLASGTGSSEVSPWYIPESVHAGSADGSVAQISAEESRRLTEENIRLLESQAKRDISVIEKGQLIQDIARLEEELRRRNRALVNMRDGQEQAAVESGSLVKCYAEKLESLEKVLVIKKAEIAARDSRIRAKDSVTKRYSEAFAKLAGEQEEETKRKADICPNEGETIKLLVQHGSRRRSLWTALGAFLAGVVVSEAGRCVVNVLPATSSINNTIEQNSIDPINPIIERVISAMDARFTAVIQLEDERKKALVAKESLMNEQILAKTMEKHAKELAKLVDERNREADEKDSQIQRLKMQLKLVEMGSISADKDSLTYCLRKCNYIRVEEWLEWHSKKLAELGHEGAREEDEKGHGDSLLLCIVKNKRATNQKLTEMDLEILRIDQESRELREKYEQALAQLKNESDSQIRMLKKELMSKTHK